MKYLYNGRPITPKVELYSDIVPLLGGITMRQFYTQPDKCVSAWKKTKAWLADEFGDSLPDWKPAPPPVSYGHPACLGAELRYPEDGEPNIRPVSDSLDGVLDFMLRGRETDFAAAPIVARYDDTVSRLRAAFPEYDIPFAGLGLEGPVTTAVLLRGQDFFLDLYDEPEKCKRLLTLITESIIEFHAFLNLKNGRERFPNRDAWLCDDFAALVPPAMWGEFVAPYWERWYSATGKPEGTRMIHCEGMSEAHLPQLRPLHIDLYQPSVSDKITLETAVAHRKIDYAKFDFLLYAFKVTEMSDAQIADWVEQTLAAGVETVRTQLGAYAIKTGRVDRIRAFIGAFEKYRVQ